MLACFVRRTGVVCACLFFPSPFSFVSTMKVLLLAPTAVASGNATTAERIRHYLLTSGHKCLLENSRCFSEPKDVCQFISVNGISAVIALHLYKAGRLLVGCGVPYGVVFGGTDVNEDVKNEHKLSVMTAVAQNARFLVAFTEELKCIAEHLWPCTRGRVYIQPQGVWTNPDTGFAWRSHLRSSGVPADTNSLLFLLVCGIRQVKDPLYLTDTFSEWHNEDSRVHLIIIGPEMDSVLSAAVKERIKMVRGVWLLPELPQSQLHAAMSDSFCLVNSSLSEGMSGAILEAMQLGLPVIARDIPGNAALITHEETGLLYTTAQEFKVQARRLMTDMSLRERLVACARRLVEGSHSQQAERRTYSRLLLELSGPEPVATASG